MSLFVNFPLFVNFGTASAPVPPPLSPENARAAIDHVTFRRVLRAVNNQSFDSGRLGALRTVLRAGPRLTCTQAAQVIPCFDFSEGQVEAAEMLHPHVVDPVCFEDVIAEITFGSDQDRVRTRLQMVRS
jgi:hypothetical protein